ncbi:hypothetical protein [Mycolicibacter senuensis]|uniref:hypothetical protein n=1 Tax=Mycolicibacter senuensis TaxID=386913 RepID=UPI002570BAEA|nr:hypothetical protein [Mycolicibacter senuensis]
MYDTVIAELHDRQPLKIAEARAYRDHELLGRRLHDCAWLVDAVRGTPQRLPSGAGLLFRWR